MRRLIPLAAIMLALLAEAALAAPTGTAERQVPMTSFTRLRIGGPVVVTVTAGPPRASVSGDPRALEGLEVRDGGGTVTVRLRPGTPVAAAPLRVTLASPVLASVAVAGGAKVAVAGLKGARIDLALVGAGTLAATGIDAQLLTLAATGNGAATLAGRAATARIAVSGAGDVDADALVAGDLTLSSDGAGQVRARARYTAAVANAGAGQVTVAGTPRCVIRPGSRGPVACGRAD